MLRPGQHLVSSGACVAPIVWYKKRNIQGLLWKQEWFPVQRSGYALLISSGGVLTAFTIANQYTGIICFQKKKKNQRIVHRWIVNCWMSPTEQTPALTDTSLSCRWSSENSEDRESSEWLLCMSSFSMFYSKRTLHQAGEDEFLWVASPCVLLETVRMDNLLFEPQMSICDNQQCSHGTICHSIWTFYSLFS